LYQYRQIARFRKAGVRTGEVSKDDARVVLYNLLGTVPVMQVPIQQKTRFIPTESRQYLATIAALLNRQKPQRTRIRRDVPVGGLAQGTGETPRQDALNSADSCACRE